MSLPLQLLVRPRLKLMKTSHLLMLLASMLFAFGCLALLAAYLITGSKKMILLRLAGASGMLASLFWILRTMSGR